MPSGPTGISTNPNCQDDGRVEVAFARSPSLAGEKYAWVTDKLWARKSSREISHHTTTTPRPQGPRGALSCPKAPRSQAPAKPTMCFGLLLPASANLALFHCLTNSKACSCSAAWLVRHSPRFLSTCRASVQQENRHFPPAAAKRRAPAVTRPRRKLFPAFITATLPSLSFPERTDSSWIFLHLPQFAASASIYFFKLLPHSL